MRQDSYCFSLEAVEISQDFLTTVTWTKLVHKHSCPEENVRFSVKTVSVNLDFWFIKDFLLKAATEVLRDDCSENSAKVLRRYLWWIPFLVKLNMWHYYDELTTNTFSRISAVHLWSTAFVNTFIMITLPFFSFQVRL